jgi:hypothetical protein
MQKRNLIVTSLTGLLYYRIIPPMVDGNIGNIDELLNIEKIQEFKDLISRMVYI